MFYQYFNGSTAGTGTTDGTIPATFPTTPLRVGAMPAECKNSLQNNTGIGGTQCIVASNEAIFPLNYSTAGVISENQLWQIRGFLKVPFTGTYTFYTSSADRSRLYIGNTLVVNNNAPVVTHGVIHTESSATTTGGGGTTTIALFAGYHAFTFQYANLGSANGGAAAFQAVMGWGCGDLPAGSTTSPIPVVAVPADGTPVTNNQVIPYDFVFYQPPTWTGAAADGFFSTAGNWDNGPGFSGTVGPAAPLQTDSADRESNANQTFLDSPLELRFQNASASPFSVTNDITTNNPYPVYVMEFNSSVAGNTVSNKAGNTVPFAIGSYDPPEFYMQNGIPLVTNPNFGAIRQLGSGSVTISSPITLPTNIGRTNVFQMVGNGSGVVNIAGGIVAGGAETQVQKDGSSTYSLTTTNCTFLSTLTISAGTLGVNSTLSVGNVASSVVIAPTGTLRGTGAITNGNIVFTNAVPGPVGMTGGNPPITGIALTSGLGTIFPGDVASTNTAQPLGNLTAKTANFTGGNGGKLILRVNNGVQGSIAADGLTLSSTTGSALTLGGASKLELHVQTGNGSYTMQDVKLIGGSGNPLGNTYFGSTSITAGVTGATILYVGTLFSPGVTATNDPSVAFTQDPITGILTQNLANNTGGAYTSIYLRFDGSVTPVTVGSFAARSEGAGAVLEWNAVSEYQNAGFNVYRREVRGQESGVRGQASEWTRVNSALIGGRITQSDPKMYRLYDWAASGIYEYKLESISVNGDRESYGTLAGPVCVDGQGSALSSAGLDAATASIKVALSTSRSAGLSAKFAGTQAQGGGSQAATAASTSSNAASRSGMAARNSDGSLLNSAAVKVIDLSSGETIANVPLARVLSRAAPASASVPAPAVSARWFAGSGVTPSTSYSALKVVYDAPGVLMIPLSSIPAGFNISRLAVQREGISIPVLAVTPDGMVVFGQGYEDDYTNKDALFLRTTSGPTAAGQVTHASGLFTTTQAVNSDTPASVTAEFHDVYFDYNNAFRPYTMAPWFSSEYLTADGTTGSTQSFTINTPNASGGGAVLAVNLWSLTQSTGALQDHALQVLVNGQAVGQAVWSGGNKMLQLTFEVPSGGLNAGDNQIDLVTPSIPGVDSQIAFLHSMTCSYARLLDGSQPVTLLNNSPVSQLYELSHVPSANAWVVDVRFPERAALVPYEAQAQSDGTYKLRFNAASGGSGQFQVVPFGMENAPLSVTKRQVKPLKTSAYVATGPSQFEAGVQPLLAQRSKEGLRGQFVDQEQLFDYYNYGRYGPSAIQKAVQSTHPQYLLLLGRTTYDSTNYSGLNVDPLCPTFLVSTTFWAQSTSDSMFGDLGRGYPEVAVGRLPVNNPSELNIAVAHVLNYGGAPASGARIHAVADRADPSAADFPAQASAMSQSLPDMAWQGNYLGVTYQTSPEVTNALTTAANGGADWIVYVGHGNASRLGNEVPRILDTDSVQAWTGDVVFLQSTCTANWPAANLVEFKSIAIQALTQPQGGISASIGTSTYMNSNDAVNFMTRLMSNADARGMRWGNALMKTQQWAYFQGTGYNSDLNKTEQIFGDPAMPVFTKGAPAAAKPATGTGNSNSAPAAGTF